MKDYMVRAITKDVPLRAFVATTKNLVQHAKNAHNLTPLTSAALGRVLTATAMMGAMLKNKDDKLTIQLKGDGPVNTFLTTGNGKGQVKGYVGVPNVNLPLKSSGKLDVGGAIGKGTLTIIMDLGLKEPYVGKVSLVNGEIAEDLAHYYAVSEQIPSAVSLGVLVDRDMSIKAAGGFIIQVMPDCPDHVVETLEKRILDLPSISHSLSERKSPEEILTTVLQDFDVEFSERIDVEYSCDCNRVRLEQVLISLGELELWDIIKKEGKADVQCHFCNKEYHFTKDQLKELLKNSK